MPIKFIQIQKNSLGKKLAKTIFILYWQRTTQGVLVQKNTCLQFLLTCDGNNINRKTETIYLPFTCVFSISCCLASLSPRSLCCFNSLLVLLYAYNRNIRRQTDATNMTGLKIPEPKPLLPKNDAISLRRNHLSIY